MNKVLLLLLKIIITIIIIIINIIMAVQMSGCPEYKITALAGR